MAFTDTIAQLPFAPRTPNASGFLPPVLRGMGHIIYLLGVLSDEQTTVSDEEAINELTHAGDHWNARAASNAVSTGTNTRAGLIGTAIQEAIAEYAGWNADQRAANLRDLVHRVLQYTADLDRELVGIRDSDPGSSL